MVGYAMVCQADLCVHVDANQELVDVFDFGTKLLCAFGVSRIVA